jgi:methionine-rich copper-binding protein CopC
VTTVTLKNLNLLTLGDTNQANALIESILYKNTDPTPTDGNRSIIMVSMTDGGVVGTSNNGYFGQNYTAFNPSLMTSTVTIDRTAPNAPVLNVPENEGVGVTNTEGQDGTSVVVSLAGTGALEGDVVTMTVKDLAPIKYTLQGLDIDSESVSLAISAATLKLLGSGSVPVKVTITDAAQNTSVVSAASVNLVNVNSAPSGASSTVIILEDNSRTFTASDFGFSDVVSDFFYGENSGVNALSAVIITALPAVGTLTLNNVNVIQNQRIPAANLSDLKYTPALNGNGTSYASIGFKVQDNGGTANGGSDTSTANTLTINVTPVNDAPTLVNQIPNQMAVFNAPFEYTMPVNTFADVDSPALTYIATLEDGSALPAWLNFDAATCKFTGTAKSTAGFNVKVTASDGALNVSNMFQIDLAPMVTSVALTGATGSQNNRLNAGDVVSASVTFSESVNVTGLPQLALNIGGNTVKADYASGSGTSVLTFNYTILSGQNDADGISIEANALSLNAGTIKDATGNHAVISIAQVMDNASYIVDNVTPLWLSSNPNDNGYLMDLAANLTLTFNEGVSKGTGTIQLYNAANTLVESFDVATSSRITGWNAKTLTIDPTANLTANTGYYVKIAPTAINDLAGNAYAGISDATMLNFMTADATGSIVPATVSRAASSNTLLGQSLSSIGDFNGDGYDDLLIGDSAADSYYSNTYGGSAYVVYGNASGTVPNLNAGTIAASLGFRVVGGNCSQLGTSLSGAGDVNGDGYMDILLSTRAAYQYANGAFASYVLYGTSNSQAVFGSRFEMYYGQVPTSMGFKIYGPGGGNDFGPGGIFGERVSQLGDVNGDGVSDWVITQRTSNGSSIGSYLMYGKTNASGYTVTQGVVQPGDGVFIGGTQGIQYGFGRSISGAGDVNGDGLADLIVSNDRNNAFVVYGSSAGVGLDLSAANIAGHLGYKIIGPSGSSFGNSVSSAGDVNGDGLADLIVGAFANNGSVFVVYGNSAGTTVDLSSGNIAASQGYKISASSAVTNLGYSVSSAGDMNGDGLNDLILSASGSNSVYVVYGNATGTNMTLGASISPSQGFVIKGPVGTAVSSAGDVNGDGLADLLLGPAGGAIGYSIILGGTQWVTSAVNGVGKVDGTSADEAIIGSAGDDKLTGGGGVDRFFAGKGNDTIVLTASDIANLANNTAGQSVKANVNGGNGFDTIQLNGGANLDLTTISNTAAMSADETSRIDNIERIDLSTDKAANTLKLHTKDVNDIAGMNVFHTGIASADGKVWTNVTGNALSATTTAKHQMLVDGDSNDSVSLNASNGVWRNVGAVSNGANNYNVYENSNTASQVLVKSGVAVQNTGAPLLISSNPTDSGYMMGLGNNITLTFDQPIQQGIGTIQLWNGTTGALVESFDVTSSALVTGWSGTTLTINPTVDLAPDTNYFLKIGDAAVQNAAGNTFTGVNLGTSMDFTTVNAAGSIVVRAPSSTSPKALGSDVAGIGDVNGDGYDDMVIGAYAEVTPGYYSPEGAAYVVYGNASGTVTSLAAGGIAPNLGFKLMGGYSSSLGVSVSGVGDVNGDGLADMLIGANTNGTTNTGYTAYVIYGRTTLGGTYLGLGIDASTGFKINGSYYLGQSVSGAGDVNGDGLADMLITEYKPDGYGAFAGAAYVIYGNSTGTSYSLNSGGLTASQGFKITAGSVSSLGYAASGAGDFNGDGLADVIVSARTYGAQNQGAAYVVYGNSTGNWVSLDLSNGIAASQGFKISGQTGTNLGDAVSSAGDVNGDGLADVVVSSKVAGTGGSAYVLYGTSAATGLDIDLNASGGSIATSRGFRISDAQNGANLGGRVASAGDVNGDGLADLIVASPNGLNSNTYIVYGNANGTGVVIDSNGQIAASQGFRLVGAVGTGVAGAGDINGDGLADLVVGANPAANDYRYGVILGGTQWVSSAVDGIGTVNGTAASEALIGSAQADTLTGGGGVDRFFAGMGNDTIVLTAIDITNLASNTAGQTAKENVNGGNGFDTIRLSGGAALDLTTISNVGAMGLEENSRIESIERIDMTTDTAANKLMLAAKDVKDMVGFNMIRTGGASADGNTWTNVTGSALSAMTKYHQLVVDGTSADGVTLAADFGFWANAGTASNGTTTYTIYQNTGTNSQVLVSSDVVVTNNDATPDVVLTGLVI